MDRKSFFIKESEMDDYQRRIVNSRSESSLIIRGCAGSGKSVIAFWRLHDIVSNNKGSAQIIVFTRSLVDYFVEGCRGEGIDPGLIDYWDSWKRRPRATDYILVDEAQDFSEESIALFRSYAKKALLLYGDTSQQIYSFRSGRDKPISMDDMQRMTQFPSEQLVFNHRLPAKVARVAQYVNAENDDLVGRCRDEGSERPFFLRYASLDAQLDAIVQIVGARRLDDVGILLPKNDQVRSTWSMLLNKGLNAEVKYNDDAKRQICSNLNFATDNPKVMTYHSAKGLQFRAVFLPCCEEQSLSQFSNPLYVAMTRTYQSLYVLYTGQLTPVLQNVPADLYESELKTRETEVL